MNKLWSSQIGFGTGGNISKYNESCHNLYIDIIRKSIDLGNTFIDTAEIYGNGYSERLIGEAIYGNYPREDIFIATKVSPENLGYNNVIKSAKNSCIRLKMDYIDLCQIHWANPLISLKETLSAMKYLLDIGTVNHIGVCNFSLKELVKARKLSNELGFDIDSIQLEYNLFDRTVEKDIIPYCEKNDITFIAYSPLDNGKFKNYIYYNLLESIANKYNKTVSQLILRWIIEKDNVIVIPTTSNINHIENNALSNFKINKEDIKFINENIITTLIEIPIENISANSERLDKFIPNPEDLSICIKNGIELKPIRVKKLNNLLYELTEGKVRYWAWIYAHDGTINNYKNIGIPSIKALIRS